jgi:hypothetical protein
MEYPYTLGQTFMTHAVKAENAAAFQSSAAQWQAFQQGQTCPGRNPTKIVRLQKS